MIVYAPSNFGVRQGGRGRSIAGTDSLTVTDCGISYDTGLIYTSPWSDPVWTLW